MLTLNMEEIVRKPRSISSSQFPPRHTIQRLTLCQQADLGVCSGDERVAGNINVTDRLFGVFLLDETVSVLVVSSLAIA